MSRVAQTKLSETKEKKKYDTKADELATKQREISVSEFFLKNRHLLGFDNPRKSILTAVKEAVDNSLDACEEAGILPHVIVRVKAAEGQDKFKVVVQDNGPGIIKQQIPNIFAKLLYGSKFHSLKQSRGQQGLGISMSVLYSQLTTGKATKIISKISPNKPAHYYELQIDTKNNEPKILKDQTVDWDKDHGTKIELEIEGKYLKGRQSVDEYIKQTAMANPYAQITYLNPQKEKQVYKRVTEILPKEAREIKPHPHGIELGNFIKMMHDTTSNTLSGFLQKDFSRIGAGTAEAVLKEAKLQGNNPRKLDDKETEKLFNTLQKTQIMSPPTDCLSPIGFELLEQSLKKQLEAEYYVSITRKPDVYRGNPFLIECAIAYGGNIPQDSTLRLVRFANKVPLLYQQGGCAITESVLDTNWKPYGLQQSGSNMPVGPAVLVVHMASVWVPFTSESKEAVAHYPEIIKEIKLALQECGRKLGLYIRKNIRAKEQREKAGLFENYIPELASSISNLSGDNKSEIENDLKKILKKHIKNILGENEDENQQVRE